MRKIKIWNKVKTKLFVAQASSIPGGSTVSNFNAWTGRSFFGVDNTQLATNETIFSIITRLANTMSSLPVKLYKDFDVVNNGISDLLINPNQNMSGMEFINKLEVSRNEHGNAYAVIIRDTLTRPIQLLPIENSTVSPFIDSDSGELYYQIRGDNATSYIHNANMIHLKHITGVNRIEGISPLKVLNNALKYDKAVQEFSLSEMEKKESFKLTYGANIDEAKQQQVIDNFRRFYSENGGILFQEPGVTIDSIPKSYNASDTSAAEKVTRARVANVFNVPLTFLNEGSAFSSNEQLMTQFVQTTLTPIVRQYEQEFNRKLLSQADRANGYYFKFTVNALLRGDTATRANFYQMGVRNGWFTQNEVRQFEDLPPSSIENANNLWISGDLYPISVPIAERNGTTTVTSGTNTTDERGENN